MNYVGCAFFIILIISTTTHAAIDYKEIQKEYKTLLQRPYMLIPHKGSYVIPFSYNNSPNHQAYESITSSFSDRGKFNKNLEMEFQISFSLLLARDIYKSGFNLLLGYTHTSWWQVYNERWSRQFRETNYAPEIFIRRLLETPVTVPWGKMLMYDFGAIHQSNGQIQEISRSWNRAFVRGIFLFGKTIVKASWWHRIKESSSKDENKDIEKYIGHGELSFNRQFGHNHFQLTILPGTRKQGAELRYSYPMKNGLRFFIKANYGHGQSLIDYNYNTQRVGIGIVLADLMTFK